MTCNLLMGTSESYSVTGCSCAVVVVMSCSEWQLCVRVCVLATQRSVAVQLQGSGSFVVQLATCRWSVVTTWRWSVLLKVENQFQDWRGNDKTAHNFFPADITSYSVCIGAVHRSVEMLMLVCLCVYIRRRGHCVLVCHVVSRWLQLPFDFYSTAVDSCSTAYGVSEQGLTSPSTHYRSFRRRIFPVNHLHWYWQPNKNNQATEHTNNIKITQPKKRP